MDLVSASQIKLYEDCPRKWGWKYIEKIPDPAGPAAALGTEVDDTQLQPWLRDDRPIDFTRDSGYIAAAGLALLPAPQSRGLEVQKHFVIPSPTWIDGKHVGFGFQGYLDLWLPRGGMPGIDQCTVHDDCSAHTELGQACYALNPIPCVADFKTTGNWKYALTAAGLGTNVQAQLYATWAMYKTKARVVDLAWVYFATKGPRKAKRVHLRVTADQVAEQFSKINDTALAMYEVRKTVTDPLELEPNPDMCEAYGGCPYRSRCNLSPGQIIDAQAAQWARKTEATVANTNQSAGGMTLLAQLRARKAGGAAPAAEPHAVDTTGPIVPYYAKGGIPVANIPSHVVGINPPESQLAPAPPVGSVEIPPAQPAPVAAAADAAPAKAKRGPGRPKTIKPPIDPSADVGQVAADRGVAAVEPGPNAVVHNVSIKVDGVANVESLTKAVSDAVSAATQLGVGDGDVGFETISVTWGREKFSPVAYNDFDVGPFEATGFVRTGETVGQANARIYAELETFAENARSKKAASYAKALTAMGGAR